MRILVATLALAVAACERPSPVWTGDTTLGPRAMVVTPQPPLEAPGPLHRVCVRPAAEGVHAQGDSLILPGGRGTKLHVVLTTPDGQRDSLWSLFEVAPALDSAGRPGQFSVIAQPPATEEEGGYVCVRGASGRDTARVFTRLELRTDRPLAIRAVTWRSGENSASP
jgi:hypothetical protein